MLVSSNLRFNGSNFPDEAFWDILFSGLPGFLRTFFQLNRRGQMQFDFESDPEPVRMEFEPSRVFPDLAKCSIRSPFLVVH